MAFVHNRARKTILYGGKILPTGFFSSIMAEIFAAIENEQFDAVPSLIRTGVSVNFFSENHGYNSLHSAVFKDNNTAILLLKANANLNAKCVSTGQSAFLLAAQMNKRELISAMLEYDANLADHDFWGRNILHYACWLGNKELALRCIDAKCDPDELSSPRHKKSSVIRKDFSAISWAIFHGWEDVVKKLIDLNAKCPSTLISKTVMTENIAKMLGFRFPQIYQQADFYIQYFPLLSASNQLLLRTLITIRSRNNTALTNIPNELIFEIFQKTLALQ